jgi:hypothetical protein
MQKELRRAARQYLVLLAILLGSLLLVTCLGSDDESNLTSDYTTNRNSHPETPTSSERRGE